MDNKNVINLQEKVEASILLASFLDTLGFKNGLYEFKNKQIPATTTDISTDLTFYNINDFFILGGLNYFPIKNLKASDDTLLLLATTEAIINGGGEINYILSYLTWFPIINEPVRAIGHQTKKSLTLLEYKIKKKKESSYLHYLKYDKLMGGNGAAIRTATIGIKWHNNIDKIIEESIIASRVTHNFYIGFLGGMVSAIFTSYAINNIPPWLWLDKLLELHESNKIIDYIHTTSFKNTIDDDINKFFYFFYKYKEDRITDILTFRKLPKFSNVNTKINDFVAYNEALANEFNKGTGDYKYIATTGIDAILYAYESLLMSIVPDYDYTVKLNNPKYSWDSIVYFSCFHIGDTDSTGVIVGSWIGALNGFKDFNINKLKDLEFYTELKNVSYKLFKQL